MKFCSVIITHYAMNGQRSETMRKSLESLLDSTTYPIEIIVVDNGNSDEDTEFLLGLCKSGNINTYVRNSSNMHFGYARNQAISMAQGDYICVADNDIEYKKDWLSECVSVLETFPTERIYATPIDYPNSAMARRYTVGHLRIGDILYPKSMRAGSNCFVIRREDIPCLGLFQPHRIAGTKWTDHAVKYGYCAVVIPGNLVTDMGLRKGYNLGLPIPISIDLKHNRRVYINTDEYRDEHPELDFVTTRFNYGN